MTDKYRSLYGSWHELVQLKKDMGAKILELIAHPDCKPEHLTEAMPRYREVVGMLRSHKPAIIKALDRYPLLQRKVMDEKL